MANPDDVDANLLFGTLAMEMDFISHDQLVEAVESWAQEKDQPLSEHLVRRGAMPVQRRDLLDPLVQEHIRQHGNNPADSLAALGAGEELKRQLASLHDSEVTQSIARLSARAQPASAPLMRPLAAAASAEKTRFRILRPHARGGLGEVFVARDLEVGREVALKEIQPRKATDAEARARFMREAEITGGLEHPGIVPVYGLGTYADGRPFYAMRFIRGKSLSEAILAFHADPGTNADTDAVDRIQAATRDAVREPESSTQDAAAENSARKRVVPGDASVSGPAGVRRKGPTEKNLELRRLLQRFIDVCEAIDYAHSRGVLHRDLKPGNIMLGRYGETLVVDWGLAKAGGESVASQTAATPQATSPDDDGAAQLEPLVASSSDSGSEPTQIGFVPGTPGYMSPEQALGHADLVGPASDIFSLGATLYHLITGRPPYRGKNAAATYRLAQKVNFPKPSAIRRGIPRGLEAICLKAMKVRIDQRYRSAKALAHDIESFLADEPLVALPEGRLAKLARWSRRHRQLVSAGSLGLAIVAMVAGLAWFREAGLVSEKVKLIGEKERLLGETERLATAAQTKRKEAEQLAQEKSALADDNARLALEEKLEADKSRKLSTFLIETFQASDPIGQGGATFFIPKATSEKLTARQILDRGAERVQTDPELARFPLARAAVMDAIGDVYRQLGLFPQALPLLTEALRIRRELLPPQHPDVAASCHNLGWYYHERGDFPKATKLYEEALAIRRTIPGDEGKRLASNTMHNLAWMLSNAGDSTEAEKIFRENIKLRTELFGPLHREVSFSKFGVGFCLIEQGKSAEALLHINTAKDELLKLEGNQDLSNAVTQFAFGVIYRNTLGNEASEAQLQRALKSCIAGLGPDNIYVGVVLYELACTQMDMGKLDEAEKNFQACLKISREQVQLQHPRCGLLMSAYAELLDQRGRAAELDPVWQEFLQAQLDRFGEDHFFVAKARYAHGLALRGVRDQQALPIFEDLVERCRQHPQWETRFKAECWTQLGLCHLKLNNPAAAEPLFREAIVLQKSRQDVSVGIPGGICYASIDLGMALAGQNKLDEADKQLAEARQSVAKLTTSDKPELQNFVLESIAEVKRKRREFADAAAATLERKALWKTNPRKLYTLAGELGDCANGCLQDKPQPTEVELAEQQKYRDLAMQTLREAFAAGYKNKAAARENPRFAALRELPEFQKLVDEQAGP